MNKIGIFFGTDSGTTRLIAKKISKSLGDGLADSPLNINRITLDDLLKYKLLILGTPTYGDGTVPGKSTGVVAGSWEEFLPQLEHVDLSDKIIALYGLGNQDKYPQRFADGLMQLYAALKKQGATLIGSWSVEGYTFEESKSVVDNRFVGLVVDHAFQSMQTDERIRIWLEQIKPVFAQALQDKAVVDVA
jgi:flavodoxin I